ncbi:MAG: GGDEF domain-containing protein [Rhizobiaceae bacterium]|jgi:diguanylate cyclase|nr:GGDEF domain-containing protein [Rhizobiaceae bacterium]MBO6725370.1 GGDEF domain-containing protein [Rhizobiaceae bacterium]
MQASVAIEEGVKDTAHSVVDIMNRAGVVGLPRNYEIYYEAYAVSNESLRVALSKLGPRPTQQDLDQLSRDFFTQSNRDGIVENAHDQITGKIEDVMGLLLRERNSLEKYGTILDRTSAGLQGRRALNIDILRKIVGIMAVATDSTIEQGKQIASSIADTSAELDEVKTKLVEYKKLADTDPLTQLNNRRAFDRAMAAIYNDEKSRLFNALIVADVDRFKDVNDRYGHPTGDRVLQHLARILRGCTTGNMVVARTGGEEFGIIVEGLSEDATVAAAEDIRTAIEKSSFQDNSGVEIQEPITVSVGVCMASEANGAEDLYAKADQALYASKNGGRNRVTKFPVPGKAPPRKSWMIYRTD